ncbi:uncharacterized protein LOC107883932 isoform X2 [Acyrthosiphon pisum]|uniref:Uncharacterized protein n=1 Tax=Acyrthosiphon pisum TaxID=7029 RepID=A0A8R2D418_ACYPI|nr:uncharacterized protein LOC107883932 isoform X2 [Acyrthosiphon pisum]|eukprot:XP_016660429.1 PREDICTED: uncharacterized protein LOC107883932 [Acyrthosiphon pisum]
MRTTYSENSVLAYVPPDNVINAYEEILETQFYVENEDLLMSFLDYFEDNWVGKITGRRKTRRQPRHPIDIWNCHYSANNGLPTTNNAVEGWHRGFTSVIGTSHPNIWKFIDGIKKVQNIEELKREQYNAGKQPQKKKV